MVKNHHFLCKNGKCAIWNSTAHAKTSGPHNKCAALMYCILQFEQKYVIWGTANISNQNDATRLKICLDVASIHSSPKIASVHHSFSSHLITKIYYFGVKKPKIELNKVAVDIKKDQIHQVVWQ